MFEQASWSELAAQYQRTERDLRLAKKKSDITSDRELYADMIASTNFAGKEVGKRALFDLGDFGESELKWLTKQERDVAMLRQKYNCGKIAEALGLTPSHVHVVHKRALDKLIRIHSRLSSGIPPELTRQQEKIFLYVREARDAPWIARKLKISIKTVENQIKIIRNLV